MKKRNIITILLLSLVIFYGCKDMHENYEQYTKEGEIIYTNKINSISTFAGDGRVMIRGFITNAYNVSEIVVTWNKGKDQTIFPYTKKYTTDTLNLIVSDLKEGSYEFSVFSRNSSGDKSIAETVFATSYGKTYKSYLTSRDVAEYAFGDSPSYLAIEFNLGNEYQRDTEVKYIDIDGNERIKVISVDSTLLEITDINIDKPILYRTYYVPSLAKEKIVDGKSIKVETTIDLFDSAWKEAELPAERPISKSSWEIVDFSTEEPAEANWGPPIQGRAAAAIDGNLGTFWHSQWNGATPGYPHYFTIDLKKNYTIYSVELFRRQGNSNGQTKFKIYTSVDGENFIDHGEFDFNAKINNGQLYPLTKKPIARYIKYEATEGPNHYAFLAEIKLYGSAE